MMMMMVMMMMPLHSGIEMICTWYIVSSHHHITIGVLSTFNGQQLACIYIHTYKVDGHMYVMHICITVKRISEGRGGMEDQDIMRFYLQSSVPGHAII